MDKMLLSCPDSVEYTFCKCIELFRECRVYFLQLYLVVSTLSSILSALVFSTFDGVKYTFCDVIEMFRQCGMLF